MTFTPSAYQQAILDFVEYEDRNLGVIARAGAAKTTTLKMICEKLPKSARVLVCAFNTKIRDEIAAKVPPHINVKTLHQVGCGAMMRAWPKTQIDRYRQRDMIRRIVPKDVENARGDIAKLVSFCMSTLEDTTEQVRSRMYDLGVTPVKEIHTQAYIGWARMILQMSLQPNGTISFDDMVYLPAKLDLKTGHYDVVLVDEAQDLNAAQAVIALNAVRTRGRVIAVGDDRQCVADNEMVYTPYGPAPAGELGVGDRVLAYRNGEQLMQTVTAVVASGTKACVRVVTKGGRALTMSLDHRLWASPVSAQADEHLVYLMYRPDKGFRVGVTNRGYNDVNNYGNRLQQEAGAKLWVLDVVQDREEALRLELGYSLRFGVPTLVFKGEGRGLNQERIDHVFAEFGANGSRILEHKHYQFDLPHWMPRKGTKQRIVYVSAHGAKNGTTVSIESDDLCQNTLQTLGHRCQTRASRDGVRLRRSFAKHADGEAYARKLAHDLGASIAWRLSFDDESLQLINAAGLFPGMRVPVQGTEDVELDEIESVTPCVASCVDLQVDDANTFFAGSHGGILSHNCIYTWRGAGENALHDLIQKLDAHVLPLSVTYRCPKRVVDLANYIVPDLEAAPTAPEGIVRIVSEKEFLQRVAPGEAVLSRTNGALTKYCLHLLGEGRRAKILGKDLAGKIDKIVVAAGEPPTLKALLENAATYVSEEADSLIAAGKDDLAEELWDNLEALRAVSTTVKSPYALRAKLEELFAEEGDAEVTQFMTVHKAKGLEFDRVWLFESTFSLRSREGENLYYVGITRAKHELNLVQTPRANGSIPDSIAEGFLGPREQWWQDE